ncbi:MAG: DUF5615 family PIN-like protein [Planctomycetaceae bacterium]
MDAVTAFDDGCAERDDVDLLARAAELGRIVFTQDEDFLVLAREWQTQRTTFHGVVYGHQLDLTIGATIRDLELICHAMSEMEIRNRVVYLPF